MNILVIGLGSMGRRRVRLLKKMSSGYNIVGIDNNPNRRIQAENEMNIKTMDNLDEALTQMKPDCAIISTSPLSHAYLIEKCLLAGCHVFTELNLVKDKYEDNINLSKKLNKVLFLSSTFLYREEICYIQNKLSNIDCNLNYQYHVGQYLPDWHPWEAVTDYFVGDKRTNGCRELFAIELPWIIKTFGKISSFQMLRGFNTKLPIQYHDNYLLLIEHENGNKGTLAVDVISRKPVRNLEIFGEDIYISWNGSPTGLHIYDIEQKKDRLVDLYETVDKQEGYASFVIENAYENELQAFLSLIKGEGSAKYTFEDDLEILNIIDEIEKE